MPIKIQPYKVAPASLLGSDKLYFSKELKRIEAALGGLYEEGIWTPVLSFETPGDLVVEYDQREGTYTRVGRQVTVAFGISTTTFTHTTASGNVAISGLPFTAGALSFYGSGLWEGITKANCTDLAFEATPSTTSIALYANASGASSSVVTSADMPTGGTVSLWATIAYDSI